MNGKCHSAILTEDELIFIPEDENSRLKTEIAKVGMKVISHFAHITMSKKASKMYLAGEGFDIFGKKAVSLWNIAFPEGGAFVNGDTVGITLTRVKFREEYSNDFLDLPTPYLIMQFKNDYIAKKIFESLKVAREHWTIK